MSEVKRTFMQELDQWSEERVIRPLDEALAEDDYDKCAFALEGVKKAIREKVLEGYRNGQAAGPRRPAAPAVARARR